MKNTGFWSFFMTKNWVFLIFIWKLLRLHKNCINIKNASWQILQNGIFLFVKDQKNFLSRFSCADNSFPRFRALGELFLVALQFDKFRTFEDLRTSISGLTYCKSLHGYQLGFPYGNLYCNLQRNISYDLWEFETWNGI